MSACTTCGESVCRPGLCRGCRHHEEVLRLDALNCQLKRGLGRVHDLVAAAKKDPTALGAKTALRIACAELERLMAVDLERKAS